MSADRSRDANAITLGLLARIAHALDSPIESFHAPAGGEGTVPDAEIVRLWVAIRSNSGRRRALEALRTIADSESGRGSGGQEEAMADTDKPQGESVVPPTVPIKGVNVPDPTTGSEPEGKDPVKEAERHSEDPDKAAKDGLA